jgi:hypothetical protein
MNKKDRLKAELETSLTRDPTPDDCPGCKQKLGCAVMVDAHRARYPTHFSGVKQDAVNVPEAVLVPLKPKIMRGHKNE